MQIEPKVATAYPELAEAVELFEGKGSQFENVFEDYLKIIDAEPDKITWEFCPNDKHVNRYIIMRLHIIYWPIIRFGNLHGGLIAAVIDVCSSFTIKLSSGIKWSLIGISVDLSVSYLRGVSPGSPIKLVCQLERIGNRLATIYTRVYDNDNNLCYTSTHTKYRTDPKLWLVFPNWSRIKFFFSCFLLHSFFFILYPQWHPFMMRYLCKSASYINTILS